MTLNVLWILVGIALIIFRDKLAKESIRFQNEKYGSHFGEKEIKFSRLLNVVGGAIIILIGALILFNDLKDRT